MKQLFLLIGLLGTHLVLAQTSRIDPVLQRAEFSRAAIRVALEELRNIRVGDNNNRPVDFERVLKRFNLKAEEALIKYPTNYEKEVIEPFRNDIEEYQIIKTSSYYTAEEKEMLLNDLYRKIQQQIKIKHENFQIKNLNNLFSVLVDSPVSLIAFIGERVTVGYEMGPGRYIYGYEIWNFRGEKLGTVDDSDQNMHLIPTYYSLFKGCYSRNCQTLLSMAFNKYLQLILDLSKEFKFDLDKGKLIILPKVSTPLMEEIPFTLKNAHKYFFNASLNTSISFGELKLLDEMIEVAIKSNNLPQCKNEMAALMEKFCSYGTPHCASTDIKKILAAQATEVPYLKDEVMLERKAWQEDLLSYNDEITNLREKYRSLAPWRGQRIRRELMGEIWRVKKMIDILESKLAISAEQASILYNKRCILE